MLQKISCASCLSAAPRQIRKLSQNFLDEFHLELSSGSTGPRPESDREPILPRFRWWQTSKSCRGRHLGEPETGDVRVPIRTQRRREVVCAVPSRQLPPKRLAALAAPPAAPARSLLASCASPTFHEQLATLQGAE